MKGGILGMKKQKNPKKIGIKILDAVAERDHKKKILWLEFCETITTQTGETKYKLNPVLLAQYIKTQHKFINIQETDTLYYYIEGIYENALNKVKELCKELYENINTYQVKETTNHIKWTTGISQDKLEEYNDYLCLNNGILNTETFKFIKHNPEMIFLEKIPITYNKTKKSSEFEKFITSSLEGQDEDIKLIQQFFGSTLVRHYLTQKALILVGEQGTGKSTLIDLLVKVLGKKNVSGISIQHLGSRFKTSLLKRKLANVYDDLSDRGLYDTSLFKQATGGSPLTGEIKHKQEPEQFNSHAKLIYTANKIPPTPDDSDAFFIRVEIVKFNKVFRGTKNENKKLKEILSTEEEKTGFFNWMIQGLKDLKKNEWKFEKRHTTEEIRKIYKLNSNPLTAFIEEMCELSDDNKIEVNHFYNLYKNYCKENGQKPMDSRVVGREIALLKLPITRVRRSSQEDYDRKVYYYEGINYVPFVPLKSSMQQNVFNEDIVVERAIENNRNERNEGNVKNYDLLREFFITNYNNYIFEDLVLLAIREFKEFSWLECESLIINLINEGNIQNTYRVVDKL